MSIAIMIGIFTLNILLIIAIILLIYIYNSIQERTLKLQEQVAKDCSSIRLEIFDRSSELHNEVKEVHRLMSGLTQCAWKIEKKIKE
jgi:hypothetical protein